MKDNSPKKPRRWLTILTTTIASVTILGAIAVAIGLKVILPQIITSELKKISLQSGYTIEAKDSDFSVSDLSLRIDNLTVKSPNMKSALMANISSIATEISVIEKSATVAIPDSDLLGGRLAADIRTDLSGEELLINAAATLDSLDLAKIGEAATGLEDLFKGKISLKVVFLQTKGADKDSLLKNVDGEIVIACSQIVMNDLRLTPGLMEMFKPIVPDKARKLDFMQIADIPTSCTIVPVQKEIVLKIESGRIAIDNIAFVSPEFGRITLNGWLALNGRMRMTIILDNIENLAKPEFRKLAINQPLSVPVQNPPLSIDWQEVDKQIFKIFIDNPAVKRKLDQAKDIFKTQGKNKLQEAIKPGKSDSIRDAARDIGKNLKLFR